MLRDNKPADKNYDKEAMAQLLYPLQNGCCHKCNNPISPSYSSIHHALIHNTKTNRAVYPGLVNHPVNLVLMCGNCHQSYGCYMQISNPTRLNEIYYDLCQPDNQKMSIKEFKEYIYGEFYEYINWCKAPK
jgi:hypothetical protein